MQLLPQVPPELINAVQSAASPSIGADLVSSFMDLKVEEKQEILETVDLRRRLDRVLELLGHRIEVLRISRDIGQQTKDAVEGRQREYILREQLKAIQKELGETEGTGAEIEELDKAIAAAGMPEEAEQQARKELKRLERMPEAAAEHSMVRTYLDWLIELPWSKLSDDAIDIAQARRILDEDHFGLDKIKRRILEYLAVRKLNPRARARSSASSARPASARPRSARASRARPGASSCAPASAASTTRPRSAATGGPTSARCPATSSRASARPAPATRYSCSTRWTSSAPGSTAIRPRRCSRSWTPSRTTPSATTISPCRSTSAR